VHEIKHDGYRLIVCRDGERVRLLTRRGYDWTDRFPAIAKAALALMAKSFTIDGEALSPDRMALRSSTRCTVTDNTRMHFCGALICWL
jgi:ATP-dependent DNA ligase